MASPPSLMPLSPLEAESAISRVDLLLLMRGSDWSRSGVNCEPI